jgi:hypothetical protein
MSGRWKPPKSRVSLECFNHVVAQQNLWEHFSKLLIYTASRVYEHCAQISQMSAYDIIRFQLVELMQEPDAIRQNITAAAYIKSRTYLSRSGIMRILAELRTGKYITMERGVLLDSPSAAKILIAGVPASGEAL